MHACVHVGACVFDKDGFSVLRLPKMYLYRVAGISLHISKSREATHFLEIPTKTEK